MQNLFPEASLKSASKLMRCTVLTALVMLMSLSMVNRGVSQDSSRYAHPGCITIDRWHGICPSRTARARVDAVDVNNQEALANLALEDNYRPDSNNFGLGVAAVEKMTDQGLLAKVAMASNSNNPAISEFAVSKLTDQPALIKVAVASNYSSVHLIAAGKIVDQEVLASIAMSDNSEEVRKTAVLRLSDQTLLAKVALAKTEIPLPCKDCLPGHSLRPLPADNNVEPQNVRLLAIARLRDLATLRQLSEIKVSQIGQMARLRIFLIDPSTENQLGVTNMAISLRSLSQRYTSLDSLHSQEIEGEYLSIVLSGGNLEKPIEQHWMTTFPPSATKSYFLPAHVNIDDIISKLGVKIARPAG